MYHHNHLLVRRLNFSYMDCEKYEEAVRDYELLCRKDRHSRGRCWKNFFTAQGAQKVLVS